MARRIGICGAIGSGKSYAAKVIARERGLHHINTDNLFKELVLPTTLYRMALTNHLRPEGVTPFVDGVYQAATMTQYLFNENQEPGFERLQRLNTINSPFVALALRVCMTDDCLVEMAVLPDFQYLEELRLDAIIMVEDLAGLDTAVARDMHRDPVVTRRIRTHQTRRLRTQDSVTNIHNLISRHPDGEYAHESEILGVFDDVVANPSHC